MKAGALIAQWRRDVDDTKLPTLWPDPSPLVWLNQAQREACTRSELLIDSSTAGLVTLVTVVSQPFINVSPLIVRIQRARPRGKLPVPIITAQELDTVPNWEIDTGPELLALVTDMQTGKLRTYPILTAVITIDLTVQRLPLEDMSDLEEDEPEVPEQYHLFLLDWMSYRAYSMDDVDASDPEKAKKAVMRFERQFGAANAKGDTWMRLHGGRNLQTYNFA